MPSALACFCCAETSNSFRSLQVIASYLADKYAEEGPSFALDTPELRAHDALAQRIHDLYIIPIQAHPLLHVYVADHCPTAAQETFLTPT